MSTMKPTSPGICHYTLLEMIAVIALIAVLLTSALRLYYEGSRLVRKSADRAQGMMDVNILKNWWRDCTRQNGTIFLRQSDKVVFTNRQSISIKNSTLFFEGPRGTRMLMLPSGMTAEIGLEKKAGEPPCLVLWVRPASYRQRNREITPQPSFRLVTALPPEVKS